MTHRTTSAAAPRRAGLLALLAATLVPLLGGCATTGAGAGDDVAAALARADERRRAGDLDGAVAGYDALLGRPECAPPVETVRAYLGRADAQVRRGAPTAGRIDAEIALASLEVPALTDVQRREFARDAETILGDADLSDRRTSEARAHLRRALELSPSRRDRDLLTYRLVLCSRLEGATGAADGLTARLLERDRPEYRDLDRRFGAPAPAPAVEPPVRQPDLTPPGVVDALPRRAWRARPARGNKGPMTTIRRITVHHSGAVVTSTSESDAAQSVRSIQRDHQESRGWADIGYHFLIDRAGRVWEGRELRWQGAHAGDATLNRGNVGICLLGDYRTQDVTPAQRTALFETLDALRREYGVARDRVEGHREVKGGTLCPGKKLEAVVDAYRRGVEALTQRAWSSRASGDAYAAGGEESAPSVSARHSRASGIGFALHVGPRRGAGALRVGRGPLADPATAARRAGRNPPLRADARHSRASGISSAGHVGPRRGAAARGA